jgi:undecaprenyl diphosphate synthase
LSKNNIPNHVAIIMDGNGRWAKNKNRPRNIGHEEGLKTLSKITQKVFGAGVKVLSVYAFSSENWNRPKNEIKHLMALFEKAIESNFQYMVDNKIKFNLLGNIKKFPSSLQEKIKNLEEITKKNKDYSFYLAANYGSKEELAYAAENLRNSTRKITEKNFQTAFYTPHLPDVDLLIRTGGETRLSNFLLWQSAYAEIYFTKILWPDFKAIHLNKALEFFGGKIRKFGKIN